MPRSVRWMLAVSAIALTAACTRPNLQSTGGGYAPDTTSAQVTASVRGG